MKAKQNKLATTTTETNLKQNKTKRNKQAKNIIKFQGVYSAWIICAA